jgi:hypothetical protein
MPELISAIPNVKDPLTLIAFLSVVTSVVALGALRTRPDLLYQLLGRKLTQQHFYQVLNRGMLYAFVVVIVLVGASVGIQFIAFQARPSVEGADQLQAELVHLSSDQAQTTEALDQYRMGLSLVQTNQQAAIQAILTSVQTIPSATAQLTLAYLYHQTGDQAKAAEYAGKAQAQARQEGDGIAEMTANTLLTQAASSTPEKPTFPVAPTDIIVADVAHVPAQPRSPPLGGRLAHGADAEVQDTLRAGLHRAWPA